jgi:serine/threonine protein phosphatase 1
VTHDYLKRIPKTMRKEIIDYLHALPLSIEVEVNGRAYQLVHGAPAQAYRQEPPYKNPVHYAVWKRLDGHERFSDGVTLVFGHTPTRYYQDCVPMELWYGQGMIGIDCGSGYPENGPDGKLGRLACLRLDDGMVFYSEEGCGDD